MPHHQLRCENIAHQFLHDSLCILLSVQDSRRCFIISVAVQTFLAGFFFMAWGICQHVAFVSIVQVLLASKKHHWRTNNTVQEISCPLCWMWMILFLATAFAFTLLNFVSIIKILVFEKCHARTHTPSTAFRHPPPNSSSFSYATEGALFISVQLSTDTVSVLRKVRILIWP